MAVYLYIKKGTVEHSAHVFAYVRDKTRLSPAGPLTPVMKSLTDSEFQPPQLCQPL